MVQKTGSRMKTKAIIVDIDGTFANCEHRRHFLAGDKPDWKSFNESCVMDTVHEWCVHLAIGMQQQKIKLIFVSGRTEEFRSVTTGLIMDHLPMHSGLYMRKDGDYRDDTVIKEEIYNEHIKDKYDILFCIDDRPKVCRMWRSLGLTVLQCDDKEF